MNHLCRLSQFEVDSYLCLKFRGVLLVSIWSTQKPQSWPVELQMASLAVHSQIRELEAGHYEDT